MAGKTVKKAAESNDWSYEATVGTIEAVITELESGNLPLAEVLAQFEEAVGSLQRCEAYLSEKQQQVNVLIETLGDT